jgi:hypothetical protein
VGARYSGIDIMNQSLSILLALFAALCLFRSQYLLTLGNRFIVGMGLIVYQRVIGIELANNR